MMLQTCRRILSEIYCDIGQKSRTVYAFIVQFEGDVVGISNVEVIECFGVTKR